jgi:hypothetical protein
LEWVESVRLVINIFLFLRLDGNYRGEITSVSSSICKNAHPVSKKRRCIGSKVDAIGYRTGAGANELIVFEISGAPGRLPTRHAQDDKKKLSRCMVDMLNCLLEDYKCCDFTLAKRLKVFGLQTEGIVLLLTHTYSLLEHMYILQLIILLTNSTSSLYSQVFIVLSTRPILSATEFTGKEFCASFPCRRQCWTYIFCMICSERCFA